MDGLLGLWNFEVDLDYERKGKICPCLIGFWEVRSFHALNLLKKFKIMAFFETMYEGFRVSPPALMIALPASLGSESPVLIVEGDRRRK